MTNQEIDRAIVRIERKSLVPALLATQINGFAIVALGTLASFAFVLGESFTALLLVIVMALMFVVSIGVKFQNHNRNKAKQFWNTVRKRGLFGEAPTSDTKLLIDKIISVQMDAPNGELLPMRQAVKLVIAYERQSQQLQAVNARLIKLKLARQTLNEKIEQLQSLGENHGAGLQSLEQARANYDALQKVAREIQGSCDRLEAILNMVRKTAQARQLHRELDQLSAPDAPANQNIEPAFEPESLEDIERQIGREIETYLQLERETEEHLR